VLRLHDTATGTTRPLELRDAGKVSMYVCGLTVYDVPHIGHGRFAIAFDVLRRYLEFCGFEVNYVSNITDIDDKIIARANSEQRSTEEVSREYEAAWWDAVARLGIARPDSVPHATGYVEKMVSMIQELVDLGVGYETADGVYLSVEAVKGYGLLARQSLDSLRAGERVDPGEEKRYPLDFALWKKAKPNEPKWDSPWGPGRPGWHTECVVMSLELLGEDFDLHGGGIDLAFPHHENERAQAVALGKRFARHWVHNGHVQVGEEKMSKSLGNFTSLTDLLARTDGRAYRLLLLRSNYRSPVEVTPETISDAEEALARLDALARRFGPVASEMVPTASEARGVGVEAAALEEFMQKMDDDLDTPAALAVVFELVRRANSSADNSRDEEAIVAARTAAVLCRAMGLELRGESAEVDEESATLVRERDEARARGDWSRADSIRDQLSEAGWVVEDGPEGTRLRRGP
jgi:cysteinyl-tRNA synthetase